MDISLEKNILGKNWDKANGGYFSNKTVSADYITEIFLHQTACFKKKQDADCLNSLYEQMNTGKWYPTLKELQQHLEKSGFKILNIKSAPALPLKQNELSERYVIQSEKMAVISKNLQREFGARKNVIEFSDKSFTAHLHYHICFCKAVREWSSG